MVKYPIYSTRAASVAYVQTAMLTFMHRTCSPHANAPPANAGCVGEEFMVTLPQAINYIHCKTQLTFIGLLNWSDISNIYICIMDCKFVFKCRMQGLTFINGWKIRGKIFLQ